MSEQELKEKIAALHAEIARLQTQIQQNNRAEAMVCSPLSIMVMITMLGLITALLRFTQLI